MIERRYFFIHAMKTAGGTLREHLRSNFAREESYPLAALDPARKAYFDIGYLASLPPERLARIRLFCGHFPFVAVEMLGLDLTTITVLRDPVDRTVSHLKSLSRNNARARGRSPEDIYDDPFFFPRFIKDHQAKLFSLTAEDGPGTYMRRLEVDEPRLELAKANLEKVDVVGIQERFGDLLEELRERFGLRFPAIEDRHVGQVGGVSASFERRIAADNRADVEFYDFARRLVARRSRRIAA